MLKTNYFLAFLIIVSVLVGCSKEPNLKAPVTDFGMKSLDNELSFNDELRVPTFTWINFVKTSATSNDVSNYVWDFGNKTNSTESTPTIRYLDAGIYYVTLSNLKNIPNGTKQKKVIVVDRYAESLRFEANDIKDDETGKKLEVFLRIYQPLKETDKNLDSLDLVYESNPQSVTGVGQEIRTFVLPAKKFTIVPSDAPVNKHFIYEIFVKSDTHEKSLIVNNPLIGRYGFYEDSINETTQMKIFGNRSNMTVVAKYDSE